MTISYPDSQQTYAVIVGIESYSDSDLTLKGLSKRSFDFAQWLLDHNVPPKNIKLFLSDFTDPENCLNYKQKGNERIEIETATADQIFNYFRNTICSIQNADLLYVFWAGHGLIDEKDNLRLLCQDFSYKNPNNIDCESLTKKLEYPSNQGKPISGFKQQIFLIEACQLIFDWNDRLGLKSDLCECGKQFNYTTHDDPMNQYHLYSTLKGQPSLNDGKFSQVLLEQLRSDSFNFLYPDMDDFAESLEKALEKEGREIYRRTWKGDKIGRLNESKVDSKVNDLELFKELLNLNFGDEQSEFDDLLEENSALIIWLRGRKDQGVQVLQEKLIHPLINHESLPPIPSIRLGGKEGILEIDQVEGKMIKNLPIEGNIQSSEDLKFFLRTKLDRMIVITFEIAEKIPKSFLKDIIKYLQEIWLAQSLREGTKLLIFFLDYQDPIYDLQISQSCQCFPDSFDENTIKIWLRETYREKFKHRCPSYFSDLRLGEEAVTIYNDSEKDGKKGNPRLVYKGIYQLFDVTWQNSQMSLRVDSIKKRRVE